MTVKEMINPRSNEHSQTDTLEFVLILLVAYIYQPVPDLSLVFHYLFTNCLS